MGELYTRRSDCRACGYDQLPTIVSLGLQTITSFPVDAGQQAPRAPLHVVMCSRCGLVQLRHTVDRDNLYRWYGYRSGTNESMRSALADVVRESVRRVNLCEGDVVIDIGSNDGTLLGFCSGMGLRRVGFEPARNLTEIAAANCERLVPDYFTAKAIVNGPKAKIIFCCAMLYDLDDPLAFLRDVAEALHPEGLFVIQMNYLKSMLENNAFDNVSHEHVTYYSLSTLVPLLERAGLAVEDVAENKVNGGSFRIYVRHRAGLERVTSEVLEMLHAERAMGLEGPAIYKKFVTRIGVIRKQVRSLLNDLHTARKRIYVYGASTRGLVQMEYFGLDSKLFEGAAERNPEKYGRLYGNTGIRCVPEDEARTKADVFFILPYQFLDAFIEREKDFLARGGQFVVALPSVRVWPE